MRKVTLEEIRKTNDLDKRYLAIRHFKAKKNFTVNKVCLSFLGELVDCHTQMPYGADIRSVVFYDPTESAINGCIDE